jgi:hypothetical protein
MGADEPDVDHAISVVDPHDQTVLVTCNIKNHTSVFEDAGISEILLNVRRRAPVSR